MKPEFARCFIESARVDKRLILLTGDYCFGMFDQFRRDRPKQYFNVGVAEQSMVGVAAGLAIGGFIPVLYTITPFLLERAFEQLKLDLGQQNLHAICVGFSDYPKDGPTHTETSCQALVSLLPNFVLQMPKTAEDVQPLWNEALSRGGPTFMKLKNSPPA